MVETLSSLITSALNLTLPFGKINLKPCPVFYKLELVSKFDKQNILQLLISSVYIFSCLNKCNSLAVVHFLISISPSAFYILFSELHFSIIMLRLSGFVATIEIVSQHKV